MGIVGRMIKNNQIDIKQNPHLPGIEVKFGDNQYSRHAHIHQTWSLSYVLSGTTMVSLGTWKSEMTEDQFITIPSGIPHLCSPEKGNPFSFVVLYVPVEYLDTSAFAFSQPRIGKIQTSPIFEFIESFVQSETKEALGKAIGKMHKFLEDKSTPIHEDWGVKLLDEQGGFVLVTVPPPKNRFQLYRYSRKLFGVGRKKISTIEKMEQAKELMSEGRELVEIALECGFYDQSHFSKVFKLYTGLTPAQYMKK